MDDVKHTLGPWMVSGVRVKLDRQPTHAIIRYDAEKKRDENICNVWYDEKTGMGFADARLISAAPDMLEVLRGIKKQVENAALDGCWWIDLPDRGGIDVAAIDAAIAKATGGV